MHSGGLVATIVGSKRETKLGIEDSIRMEGDQLAVPTAYLTSVKSLEAMLNAIQTAQAPKKFSQTFLEGLGFKSKSDRLIINVLKSLGFLTPSGEPTQRYFDFLDPARGGQVLALSMREAYADIFELNRNAQTMPRAELKGKLKTLTQGQYTDAVLSKMATTFDALAKQADWAAPTPTSDEKREGETSDPGSQAAGQSADDLDERGPGGADGRLPLAGLSYAIHIQLPESRDQAVYDALFRSLRNHLFQ